MVEVVGFHIPPPSPSISIPCFRTPLSRAVSPTTPMEPVLNYNSNNNGSGNTTTTEYEDPISWFEDVSKNAGSVQTQILSKILKQNHGVEYLKKWLGNYNNIIEMEPCALESLFTSVVPLASHVDFEPYIQRISDGDTAPLLTQHPITTLSLRYLHLFIPCFLFSTLLLWGKG